MHCQVQILLLLFSDRIQHVEVYVTCQIYKTNGINESLILLHVKEPTLSGQMEGYLKKNQ